MSAQTSIGRAATWVACGILALTAIAQAQSERTFPQSKAAVEKALRELQGGMAGRLPVLDGFAQPTGNSLDHYQRGFYQATAELQSTANGTVVRVTAKVTAWYTDPSGAHSGYQLLKSNGRVEGDLLDQLSDQLASTAPAPKAPAKDTSVSTSTATTKTVPDTRPQPALSAPEPSFPTNDKTFSSSVKEGLSSAENQPADTVADKNAKALQSELDNLQDVLKNMAHPRNLVAVKKSGTPVVANPSLTAKPEFLASEHDEFELLNFNQDWVHVKISGISRGWIWRNSVEMPDGIPDTAAQSSPTQSVAADLFRVVREETAPFPGDWEPLRSKNVKILTVQKVDESAKDAGPKDRLEYSKFLLEKNFPELSKAPDVHGIVVIFDAADGGMIAATVPVLQQWKAGTLSDAALWHNCFFDPPETFDSAAASGSK